MRILLLALALAFSGCTGYITGYEYTKEDAQEALEILEKFYKDRNVTDKIKDKYGL